MAIKLSKLSRLGFSSFHPRRAKRGTPDQAGRMGLPGPGSPAQQTDNQQGAAVVDTGTVVCGICGKPARDDQYTVPYRARRTGTFDEPPPQERIAHTECFRREILRLDW